LGPALTPVAGHEARVVSTNLLEGPSTRPDYSVVPSAVFTIPPLARVGLLETEARSRGLEIDVHSGDMSGWYTSRRLAEPVAAFKTITDARTGRLLGAHLLAGHAAETINLFALAMRAGLTASDVKHTLFAYPTAGSDVAYML
jgi:glutathione reductase (NADPH)